MVLGRIIGKTSTTSFKFEVSGDAKKFQYIQIPHKEHGEVLAQILEIEKDRDSTIAYCSVIGYSDGKSIRGLRDPFEPGTNVLRAEDDFVKKTLGLSIDKGAYVGLLEGRENLRVYLDINQLITKHVCILAKSGGGKSYVAGVLLEEIFDRNIPVLIIDPHGEYSSIKYPNQDKKGLERFGLKPNGYLRQIQEYSPDTSTNTEAKPLRLSSKDLTPSELLQLLPAKLSNAQKGLMYSAVKNIGGKATNFDELILSLETEENSAKWTLINILEYLQKLSIFSDSPTYLEELVYPGKASIINLKGIPPEISEVVVYKLLKDLFEARKKNKIPPFFLVVEEAHNFAPERGFGEVKSSNILRTIAAEGRKFGLGICVISQRPAKVDKNVISQCTTQIILKVTNPNDLRAISASVEGITNESEGEIKNLSIGTAMVVGAVNVPLFVNIRTRKSKHGGEAVDILGSVDKKDEVEDFSELLPLIKPKFSIKDIKLMSEKPVRDIKTILVPCAFFNCDGFNLLVNLSNGELITDVENIKGVKLPKFDLTKSQLKVFKSSFSKESFTPADLFAKSGLQFSEIHDTVNILSDKGYFDKERKVFVVSNNYKIYNSLEKHNFFGKVEFSKIKFDKQLDKGYDFRGIKEIISNFVSIQESKECWLVSYRVGY